MDHDLSLALSLSPPLCFLVSSVLDLQAVILACDEGVIFLL